MDSTSIQAIRSIRDSSRAISFRSETDAQFMRIFDDPDGMHSTTRTYVTNLEQERVEQ